MEREREGEMERERDQSIIDIAGLGGENLV